MATTRQCHHEGRGATGSTTTTTPGDDDGDADDYND
jgi:hypothetical protein